MATTGASPKKTSFSWFKFARWTFLAVLIMVLLVMLKTGPASELQPHHS